MGPYSRNCSICKKKDVPINEWWDKPYKICTSCIKNRRKEALNSDIKEITINVITFKKVIIKCVDCGKEIEKTANSLRRCKVCKAIKKKEYQRRYQEKKLNKKAS